MFLPVRKEQVKTIAQWGKISNREWCTRLFAMAGNKRSNLVKLIIPKIDWSLNVVLIDKDILDEIYNSLTHRERHLVECSGVEMLFVWEEKSVTRTRGVSLSM
jgi:hypothetical protein